MRATRTPFGYGPPPNETAVLVRGQAGNKRLAAVSALLCAGPLAHRIGTHSQARSRSLSSPPVGHSRLLTRPE